MIQIKTIVRNFLSVVRRYSLAAILNILGLSVAFAAFMVIMIQLDYDLGFDKFHEDYDKIFRLEITDNDKTMAVLPRPFAELFLESSPHIVAGTFTHPFVSIHILRFREENGDMQYFYREPILSVSPEYTDVFTFDILEGSKDALKTPDNMIIPLSLSHKYFGNEPAVGKQLIYGRANLTVGAVYRDFPSNSILNNYVYITIPNNENIQSWTASMYPVYFRVNDPSNLPLLLENFKHSAELSPIGPDFDWNEIDKILRFTALPDVHFVTDAEFDRTPKASKTVLMVLFAIAIVLIAIAAINFTNFSTALAPVRMKSINTQRVLGSQQRTLRLSLVSEAVFLSLLSYFVAIGLIILFRHTHLAKLIDADLSLTAHPLIVGGTALMALLAGVLSGLYPAFYMTSFTPACVLKGSFGLSSKGKKLRNTLIGVQFISSFALIIGASFIYLQNYFMQHSPLGYDKDALIVTEISGPALVQREALGNQLKSFSGIEEITYCQFLLSENDKYQTWGTNYKGEMIYFQCLAVDYTFLKVMGIDIYEGRDFRIEDNNMEYGAYVFNETAQKKYDMELNTTVGFIGVGEIIGFMRDIKFTSFRATMEPMAFCVTPRYPLTTAYIKIKAGSDMRAAMSHVRNTLAEFYPGYPFEVRFFDEVLQRVYEKERSLGLLISLFSLIAIFISMVGVFGLVVFDSECRRKEIGIRKVHGSSISGIILLFNKAYFYVLLICFVIAAPLAWYAVSRWLENFAYKTQMYWWVYLFAFAAVAIITAGTVTFQNWRIANENPVHSLKSE